MLDLQEWGSTLLKLAEVPGFGASLFVVCRGIGGWLEREADTEWREAARAYLRNGTWFSGSIGMLSASSSLFSKTYGTEIFSWFALKRCILLATVVSLILFIGTTVIRGPFYYGGEGAWFYYMTRLILS